MTSGKGGRFPKILIFADRGGVGVQKGTKYTDVILEQPLTENYDKMQHLQGILSGTEKFIRYLSWNWTVFMSYPGQNVTFFLGNSEGTKHCKTLKQIATSSVLAESPQKKSSILFKIPYKNCSARLSYLIKLCPVNISPYYPFKLHAESSTIWEVFLCLDIVSKRCHFFLNFGALFETILN